MPENNVEVPQALQHLLNSSQPLSKEEQLKHSWNSEDRSKAFRVIGDKLTCKRDSLFQTTDAIRGKTGYDRGLHVWQISWKKAQRGTHAVVGVATKDAPLTCKGYQSLVGQNDQSWGWDIGDNQRIAGAYPTPNNFRLCHDLENTDYAYETKYPLNQEANFDVPESFQVCLDMDEGTLGYIIDGKYRGHAFKGLEGKKLYPIVSSVYGEVEITQAHVGSFYRKYCTILYLMLLYILHYETPKPRTISSQLPYD